MKVLLHICCAVCATACVERLRQEGYWVSGYFYNPNIQPQEEYWRRLKQTEELARGESFPLIVGDYDVGGWFAQIKGSELEPEGGRRCTRCFRLRLKETARVAKERGFATFTTTLTVSPHKDSSLINEIGQEVDKEAFLVRDFKKQNGFKRAVELARQRGLYRQDYCGCIFSLKESRNDERLQQKTCASGDKGQASPD